MTDDTRPAKALKPEKLTGTFTVRGPVEGRWRAGQHFTPVEQTFNVADFTASELAEIEADLVLTVKRFG